MNDETNGQIVIRGAVGAGSSFAAWFLSHVKDLNNLLQFGCLSLGFTISVITLWKLVIKKRDEK